MFSRRCYQCQADSPIPLIAHPGGSKGKGFAFAQIAEKPLLTHKVIVQLIAATKTAPGLTIASAIDATRVALSSNPEAYRSLRSWKDFDSEHI